MRAFAKIEISLPSNHSAITEHLSESATIYNPFYFIYKELHTSFGSFTVVFPFVCEPFPPTRISSFPSPSPHVTTFSSLIPPIFRLDMETWELHILCWGILVLITWTLPRRGIMPHS